MGAMNAERQARLAKALEQILQILIAQYQPEKIILFGSMASGDIGEWSDLDLVIIKDTPLPFFKRLKQVVSLCHSPVGTDFLVYTPSEFAQMIAEDNLFILDEVIGKGKVLYERVPALQTVAQALGQPISSELETTTLHMERAPMNSDFPRQWLAKAGDDLAVAGMSLKAEYFSHACFLSQQCIEKALKAYVIAKARTYPRIHNLVDLLERCEALDSAFAQFRADCEKVDEYYIPTRYPAGIPGAKPTGMPSAEDAKEAIAAAENILNFVKEKLP